MRRVIIINGPVAAGKTTLLKEIKKQINIPIFSRDEMKEIMFEWLGTGDRKHSEQQGKTSWELLFYIYEQQIGSPNALFGMESNFISERHSKALRRHNRYFDDTEFFQIVVTGNFEILHERFKKRIINGRHKGHADEEVSVADFARLNKRHEKPMDLPGPIHRLDTTVKGAAEAQSEILNQLKKFIK